MTRRGYDIQVEVAAGSGQRGIPMSAYEVLDHVLDGNFRLAPPTMYRTPAALIELGGAHRLESIEALAACGCERGGQVPIFSDREECSVLEEALPPQFADEPSRIAGPSGFTPARQGLEVHGRCARCGSPEAPA